MPSSKGTLIFVCVHHRHCKYLGLKPVHLRQLPGGIIIDFGQFLEVNSLLDKPSLLWNCGFALCPKTSKVLAPTGAKTVYYTTSSEKGQITTLACINAAGGIIPPMHIFAGVLSQESALEDYIQISVMLQYNNREIYEQ